ncbi:MAG: hypothetical protein Q8L52_03030 [bacterium]|nr:hypothetical protein [bacterium]
MSTGWDNVGERAEKGPWSLWVMLVIAFVVISATGYALGWFGEAAQVARDEFGPKAALEKYSWFIDQANRIEKMDQDLKIFEGRAQKVQEQYQGYGKDMAKWPPHIQVQYNQAAQQVRDDLAALASQRNNLVREYNAASEKFNWSPFQTRPDKPKERFHSYATS